MRNNDVTIAKALAIILMVLAHTRFSQYGGVYINMFHMPLFFFMSGYCFKEKYLSDAYGFINKRVTGVYLPYLKWSLLFLFVHNLFFYANIYSDEYGYRGQTSSLYSVPDFMTHGLHIVTAMFDHEQLLGGFWFLKSLFVGSFIFYLTRRLFDKWIVDSRGRDRFIIHYNLSVIYEY